MHLRLSEPLGIDPCVDIVIHKLFGDPAHEAVLLNFLNAVLAWPVPVVRARVRNPFTPDLYKGQRGLILDIRAEDEQGRIYQIEMQRRNDTALPQRMLWSWSRVYGAELGKGEDHAELRPVIAVWICETDIFPASAQAHLRFQMREEREGFLLHGDAQIDVLQLRRWWRSRTDILASKVGAWFWFFNEAEAWTEVPAEIVSPTMEQAMEILHDFRKDTYLNDLYRGRAEAERVERGAQKALERALRAEEEERRQKEEERRQKEEERHLKEEERRQKEEERHLKEEERRQKEAALLAKEAALQREASALAEAERLRALLLAAGISLPDPR
jgi:predicted transposase/invertase (TIGR01784 family)